MYSTCIFCTSPLGRNEALEHFPVGRRLAFDAEKGRLWVICPSCARWNLSPIEERWEGIEEAARRFRDTHLRTSTGNVGLARLADGTDLVRVGRPLRPEFAAWRYGDVMLGRLRHSWYVAGAVTATAAGVAGALLLSPLALAASVPFVAAAVAGAARQPQPIPGFLARRTMGTLRDEHGERVVPPGHTLYSARMRRGRSAAGPWAMDVMSGRYDPNTSQILERREVVLAGPPALRALGVFLAGPNSAGGNREQVRQAVRLMERSGSPERWLASAEDEACSRGWGYQSVWVMPLPVRLALEMAAHEEAERRALHGELALLERAWRDAEEVARIADGLAVNPDATGSAV